MIDELTTNTESPTLQLADGYVIHCGPENELLRHVVCRWLGALDEQQQFEQPWLPLVLYGESLCGKSIVAHGLANAWRQRHPQQTTILLTAADLARSLKKTELADDIDRFTRQMRQADLVVLDDIQHLTDRDNAQVWAADLIDRRKKSNKPTIVTCNANVASSKFTHRLRSRLSSGLSICISLPYAATRKEIILRSAQSFNLNLVEQDVDHLVEVTSGKPISGIQSMVASVATSDEERKVDVADLDSSVNQEELILKLIRSTARQFGVRVADIKGPSRRKNLVLARSIAMFLIREVTPLSLVEVGQHFRNRDHSTVRHACEKVRNMVVKDDAIRKTITSICNSLEIRLPNSWFDLLNSKSA